MNDLGDMWGSFVRCDGVPAIDHHSETESENVYGENVIFRMYGECGWRKKAQEGEV
jgi:hypothetical protein